MSCIKKNALPIVITALNIIALVALNTAYPKEFTWLHIVFMSIPGFKLSHLFYK
jgi:hypothetical protein